MQAQQDPVLRRLKIVRGQLDGLIRMVEEDRYCIDISNQLMAAQNALKGINREILRAHLEHCVASSLESKNSKDVEEKMEEMAKVIDTLTR